ncbi:AKAP7 2'5' RNA ligase-like domain-containing protein [Dunaliella salina]|uniref:AKAP7 2'5' RNA ligase-like domain-containing protein n=1 Tax=Dunaliella salina TaxID=3046 RepID=A0ABQ7G869_DUNSA|nr:AKAP7 2'5' RNA ligase-like domain-containing protein [Dunaliella salina]|eukprot:KAF5830795.1 AKAP7 2'5' RNA ligase-like domain-containing protein [Dunaliella salina]
MLSSMKPRSVLLKLQSQDTHILRRAPAQPEQPATAVKPAQPATPGQRTASAQPTQPAKPEQPAPVQHAAPAQQTNAVEEMEAVRDAAGGSHQAVQPFQGQPTHFLAVRMSSPRVKEVIGQVHSALESHSPGLAPALESPMKAHITLGVMCLKSQQDVAGAVRVLHKSAEALLAAQALKPVSLQVRGLGSFGNSVLFLNIHDGAPAAAAQAIPPATPPAATLGQVVSGTSPSLATAEMVLPAQSAQGHADHNGGVQGYMHLHTITSTLTTCFAGMMKEEGRAFKPHITVCKLSKLKRGRGRSRGNGRGYPRKESNRGGPQHGVAEGPELGMEEAALELHEQNRSAEGLHSQRENLHQLEHEHVQQRQPRREQVSLDASDPGDMCVDDGPQDLESMPLRTGTPVAKKKGLEGEKEEEMPPQKRLRTEWSADVNGVCAQSGVCLPTPTLLSDPPPTAHAPPLAAAGICEKVSHPGQPTAAVSMEASAAAAAAAAVSTLSPSTLNSNDRHEQAKGSQEQQQQQHERAQEVPDPSFLQQATPQQAVTKDQIQALRRQRKERQHEEKQRKKQQQQQKQQKQQHQDQGEQGKRVQPHEQSMREPPIRGIPREAYQAFLDVDAGGVVVEEVLLCNMAGKKQEDGFYQVVASLPLHPSALSTAQQIVTAPHDRPRASTTPIPLDLQAEAIHSPGPGELPASLVAPHHTSAQRATADTIPATDHHQRSQRKRKWCCLM